MGMNMSGNGNRYTGMGGNGNENPIPAHLYVGQRLPILRLNQPTSASVRFKAAVVDTHHPLPFEILLSWRTDIQFTILWREEG